MVAWGKNQTLDQCMIRGSTLVSAVTEPNLTGQEICQPAHGEWAFLQSRAHAYGSKWEKQSPFRFLEHFCKTDIYSIREMQQELWLAKNTDDRVTSKTVYKINYTTFM